MALFDSWTCLRVNTVLGWMQLKPSTCLGMVRGKILARKDIQLNNKSALLFLLLELHILWIPNKASESITPFINSSSLNYPYIRQKKSGFINLITWCKYSIWWLVSAQVELALGHFLHSLAARCQTACKNKHFTHFSSK